MIPAYTGVWEDLDIDGLTPTNIVICREKTSKRLGEKFTNENGFEDSKK